jgi:hypothetical protein
MSSSSELGLLPPPLAGEGWGGGEHARTLSHALSLSLPRKPGREYTECAPRLCGGGQDHV